MRRTASPYAHRPGTRSLLERDCELHCGTEWSARKLVADPSIPSEDLAQEVGAAAARAAPAASASQCVRCLACTHGCVCAGGFVVGGAHTTVALLPVLSVGLCSRILSRSSRFLSIGQVCIECGGSAEHIVGCADVIALELEYAVESARKIGPILEGEPISNKRAHARDFRMRERTDGRMRTDQVIRTPRSRLGR